MIIKSFELNKVKLDQNKLILLYGKNEGLKNESINDLLKEKNRLKISTRVSKRTAERDKRCEISPIILCLHLWIAQGAYNFHHVLQKFLLPQTYRL